LAARRLSDDGCARLRRAHVDWLRDAAAAVAAACTAMRISSVQVRPAHLAFFATNSRRAGYGQERTAKNAATAATTASATIAGKPTAVQVSAVDGEPVMPRRAIKFVLHHKRFGTRIAGCWSGQSTNQRPSCRPLFWSHTVGGPFIAPTHRPGEPPHEPARRAGRRFGLVGRSHRPRLNVRR